MGAGLKTPPPFIMKNVMSVDWDFFFPDAYDYWDGQGIDETETYLINAWRDTDKKDFRLKSMKSFWKTINKFFVLPKVIHLSDSHKELYRLLKNDERLYLFDSHHDCYNYNKETDCGNWGTHWLHKNKNTELNWISQLKARDTNNISYHIHNKALDKIMTISYKEFIQVSKGLKIEIDCLHICRSGCWSPPWFDDMFIKFARQLGVPLINIEKRVGLWRPFTDRAQEFIKEDVKEWVSNSNWLVNEWKTDDL